ncbi:MAG: transglycosylase SLT domain-containing protein [candidate division Zixibacteria bacterium]|nr:transglycosylase SLT domain-containing protein [candidate division Zixibacteria bacterium]
MTLGVKVARKSGIMVSRSIGALLILLYVAQSAFIFHLLNDRHELRCILREQQLQMNELREKLKILEIIEDFQAGFDQGEVAQLTQVIYEESKRYGYDPLLILAVILTESSFRKGQVSSMGAQGLMQVKPSVGYELTRRRGIQWKGELSLFEPAFNVQLGTLYLFELILKFRDVKKAIIAYNVGENALKLRLKQGGKLPSFYLSKVMKQYKQLKEKYDHYKG